MPEPINLQVGVKALIFNKDDRVLILQRSLSKYPDIKGRWDIPGGRIEPGTDLITNLTRELKEETNLDLIGTPKLLMAQDILHIPGRHIVRLTYLVEVSGDIKLDINENETYKWKSPQELKNFPDLDIFLKEVINSSAHLFSF